MREKEEERKNPVNSEHLVLCGTLKPLRPIAGPQAYCEQWSGHYIGPRSLWCVYVSVHFPLLSLKINSREELSAGSRIRGA